MQQFTLTKEEFITRTMAGDVFIHESNKLFYDSAMTNPFRYGKNPLHYNWDLFDSNNLFTLEQPKPKIERRWKYRRDTDGITEESLSYYSDESSNYFKKDWYKAEDCFIDVEIKG